MAVSGTDTWGAFLDTGCATQPTARALTDVEFHRAGETDSGSSITVTSATTNPLRQKPHRGSDNPR